MLIWLVVGLGALAMCFLLATVLAACMLSAELTQEEEQRARAIEQAAAKEE